MKNKQFIRGRVYRRNHFYVLCHTDVNPNNDNECPMFVGITVRTNNSEEMPRGERTSFSKDHYFETDLTINDFDFLTNTETGLWKKWFPEWWNETTYKIQKPTIKPEDEEDYDPSMWDLTPANGIG